MFFGDILNLLVSGLLQKQISWLDAGPLVNNQRVSLVMGMSLISDASEDLTKEEEIFALSSNSRKESSFHIEVHNSLSQSSF